MIWEEWRELIGMPLLIATAIGLFFIGTAIYMKRGDRSVSAVKNEVDDADLVLDTEPVETETRSTERSNRIDQTMQIPTTPVPAQLKEVEESIYPPNSSTEQKPEPINGNYFLELASDGSVKPFEVEERALYLWQ